MRVTDCALSFYVLRRELDGVLVGIKCLRELACVEVSVALGLESVGCWSCSAVLVAAVVV